MIVSFAIYSGKSTIVIISSFLSHFNLLEKNVTYFFTIDVHQAKHTKDVTRIFCARVNPNTIWLDADLQQDIE